MSQMKNMTIKQTHAVQLFNVKLREEQAKIIREAEAKIWAIQGIAPNEEFKSTVSVTHEYPYAHIRFECQNGCVIRNDRNNADVFKEYCKENKLLYEAGDFEIRMNLGEFMIHFAELLTEKLGTRCADGGKCHHSCESVCFRKESCVPLTGSNLDDQWQPLSKASAPRVETVTVPKVQPCTFVDDDETKLFNGMFQVKNRVVTYRGFTIKPKLDMGDHPWRSHANVISTGWVVLDRSGCLALPGACWDSSLLACRASIDMWIEADFDAKKFWELMAPFRY